MTAIAAFATAPARVRSVRRETHDTVTLALEPPPSVHPAAAGRFDMLYVPGVGESAISRSGDPSNASELVYTVRAVGPVTEALCAARQHGVIGVRGPFGRGWPVDEARGLDLVLVAGGLGLAPLRPVIYEVLRRRAEFGRFSLLVGARAPDELIFQGELAGWRLAGDVDVRVAVDHASPTWKGYVGVVPALLGGLGLDPSRTVAFVCGPEVMMRFTVRELGRLGVPEARMQLAMERNMKCAVGFCGHCMFGPSFICRDGPVLPYDRIRNNLWTAEL